MNVTPHLWWFIKSWLRDDRAAIAPETAIVMAALAFPLFVAMPETYNGARAKSLLIRSTQLTADVFGASGATLDAQTNNASFDLAKWAIRPYPSGKLAMRVQSFVRSDGGVTQQWSATSGSACEPGSTTPATAASYIVADDISLIVVNSCFVVQSITGMVPDYTISSNVPQVARDGNIDCSDCNATARSNAGTRT
jgi:hypothetical protein